MEYYLGQICQFAFNFTPYGFLPCQGQLLSISQNNALFALLGTTYGGDGRTTFGLPDLRGKSVLDQNGTDTHYYIAVYGIFPSRA